MAKGRLGKAKVASKATTEIYKNTSGAEASVSVIGQSTSGTDFYLHVDDGSDSLVTNTTLLTEAYNERFVDYNAGNTALTDPAPTYAGRFSFFDTTNSTSTNFDSQFEAYVNSNTTTYTLSNQTEYWVTSNTFMPYESWKSARAGTVRMGALIGPSYNGASFWDESVDDVSEEDYYNRVINGSATGRTNGYNMSSSYYNMGLTLDPWAGDDIYALGVATNGYQQAVYAKSADSSFSADSRTSNSWWYQTIGNSFSSPSATYNYRYLHLQKGVALGDGVQDANRFVINIFGTNFYADNASATSKATAMVDESLRRVFYWGLGGSARRGGQVVYFQYNPSDKLHYVCYYQASNQQMYLATLDVSTADSEMTNNLTVSMSAGGAQGESRGVFDISDQLSLTVASPFAFPTNQDNTARCTFIGTTTSPLWALVFFRYNDNTASNTYYSTDLKTWQRSTDYFGSDDYLKVTGDTTITSNGGVVNAEKSNIVNVGDDGVLEQGTSFFQYERTGLVLSNNDRIVVYNSGANDCVVQVMGYEGDT